MEGWWEGPSQAMEAVCSDLRSDLVPLPGVMSPLPWQMFTMAPGALLSTAILFSRDPCAAAE